MVIKFRHAWAGRPWKEYVYDEKSLGFIFRGAMKCERKCSFYQAQLVSYITDRDVPQLTTAKTKPSAYANDG